MAYRETEDVLNEQEQWQNDQFKKPPGYNKNFKFGNQDSEPPSIAADSDRVHDDDEDRDSVRTFRDEAANVDHDYSHMSKNRQIRNVQSSIVFSGATSNGYNEQYRQNHQQREKQYY